MEKIRDPRSQAVVDLRRALSKNQSQFANDLKVSKVTIARYETSMPPNGKALVKLAGIAERTNCIELRDRFRSLYAKTHFFDVVVTADYRERFYRTTRGVKTA